MTTTPGTSNIATNLLNSLPLGVVTETGKVRLDSPSSLLAILFTEAAWFFYISSDKFGQPTRSTIVQRWRACGHWKVLRTNASSYSEKKKRTNKQRPKTGVHWFEYDLSFINVTINGPINNTYINTFINTGIYTIIYSISHNQLAFCSLQYNSVSSCVYVRNLHLCPQFDPLGISRHITVFKPCRLSTGRVLPISRVVAFLLIRT